MKSQPGRQTTAIHILGNISRIKGDQIMRNKKKSGNSLPALFSA